MEKIKLESFSSLFKKSINDFKSCFENILLFSVAYLGVIFVTPLIIIMGLSLGILNVFLGLAVVIIGVLALLTGYFILNNGLLYSLRNKSKLKESLKFSLKNFWPLAWISIAIGAAIFSGAVAFIIPGIIISFFLTFSVMVFMDDGTKGINALVKSKNYIKGHFGEVAGKIALLGLIAAVASIVLSGLGPIGTFAANILLITPFSFCFLWNLFESLKKIEPDNLPPKKRDWVKPVVIIGLVLSVITITILSLALIVGAIFMIQTIDFTKFI